MEAEIIAVGSELLTPARLDTNSLFLTERLARRGIDVVRKAIIGDDRERLAREIRLARQASQVVILTGGLGPTLDDITREAAADALGRELILQSDLTDWIKKRFASFGRKMSENNRRQAYLLSGAEALPNPNGTAPGQWYEDAAGVVMLLPGPPKELQPMFLNECEPRLDRRESPFHYFTASMRISGMGESDVDDLVGPIYSEEPRVRTTILAAPGDIQLHLRGRGDTLEEARQVAEELADKVAAALSDRVYTRDNEPLEAVVGRLLRERHLQLGLAESVTGGMLAEKVTSVPGSSAYFSGAFVSYSERSKIVWLGVSAETMERYGPVSEEAAREMADHVRQLAGGPRAVGVSVTGIAGPGGGTEKTPVGTVYIGVADLRGTVVERRKFGAERERNRALSAQTALELLRRRLLEIEPKAS